MLPEERELDRLEAQQADLQEQVTSAELALETTKTETAQFQQRYYQTVGKLYARLDELNAQIAKAEMEKAPDDAVIKEYAHAAEKRAKTSAEEIGLTKAKPAPPPEISLEIKQLYRQAVKLMHPDLALTEHERQRRTELMMQVNLAYESGNREAIEKLIREYGEDPEAIVGEDVASRIVKSIRRIAQLMRRLGELQTEIEAQQKTELFQFRQIIQKAEERGDNPLDDLAQQLMSSISERERLIVKMKISAGEGV